MQGSSRAAAIEGQQALDAVLAGGSDAAILGDDLFNALAVIDGSAALRRALTDPSGEAAAKRALSDRIFGGKVGEGAKRIIGELAAQRWVADRDLTDSLESLAVQSVLAGAERAGRIDDVESQLFRFERTVAGDRGLRDALSLRNTDAAGKSNLVARLLEGKAAPETVRLARQAVRAPRGRKVEVTLAHFLSLASVRRDELAAVVTSATALSEQQEARLRTALESIYGKSVTVNTVIDPAVVGGIRVRIGDEVVDGTIARRIDEARRHIAGGH